MFYQGSDQPRKHAFIQKGNYDELITKYFRKYKSSWIVQEGRLNHSMIYDFKWLNSSLGIEWGGFKNNQQIINKVQNALHTYANKNALIKILRNFEKEQVQRQQSDPYFFKIEEFYPQTFMLNLQQKTISSDEQSFFDHQSKGTWILKQCYNNRGRGIDLITNIHEFKQRLQQNKYNKIYKTEDQYETHIIQKYLDNPLLIEKKKFDIRCYVLIACVDPLLILFHHGYIRRSILDYEPPNSNDQKNILTHLTNQAVQQNHPDYNKIKEDTIWSMSQLTQYLIHNNKLEAEQVHNMYNKMELVLKQAFLAGLPHINRRYGTFELFGCDIMFDDVYNPILIEINCGPSLSLDTVPQKIVIPHVVWSSIDLAFELNSDQEKAIQKIRNNEFDIKTFSIMINELNVNSHFFQDYSVPLKEKIEKYQEKKKPLYYIAEKKLENDMGVYLSDQRRIVMNNNKIKLNVKKIDSSKQRFLTNLANNFRNIQTKYFNKLDKEKDTDKQELKQGDSNKEWLLQQLINEQEVPREVQSAQKKLKQNQKLIEQQVRSRLKLYLKQNNEQIYMDLTKAQIQALKPFVKRSDFETLVTKKLQFNEEQEMVFNSLFCRQDKQKNVNFLYLLGEGEQKYVQQIQSSLTLNKTKAYKLAKDTFIKIGKVLDQEKINLQGAFQTFDQDKDGFISLKELQRSLGLMKFHLSKIEIEMIHQIVDLDKDGYISYSEFLYALGRTDQSKQQNQPKSDSLKKSEEAKISKGEVKSVPGTDMSTRKSSSKPGRIVEDTFKKIYNVLKEENVAIEDAFFQMDIDEDKHISQNDLQTSLKMMGFEYNKVEIQEIFKIIDQQDTGKINYEQFCNLLNK